MCVRASYTQIIRKILYLGKSLTNNKMILFVVVRGRKWLQALKYQIKLFLVVRV